MNKSLSLRKILIVFFIFLAGILGADLVTDSEDSTTLYNIEKENFNDTKVSEDKPYLVTDVIDGDTIEVSGVHEVRLLGIDAPERGECYFSESKSALDLLIGDEYVRLEKDVSGVDNFGRLLRYVFLPQGSFGDDIFANDFMVTQGFADIRNMGNDKKYEDILLSGRNEAIAQKTGMWQVCKKDLSEQTSDFEVDLEPPNSDCVIKGNVSKHDGKKRYFLPGCANYKRTKIDPKKGDKYFCTERDARKAGFTLAPGCK